MGTTLKLAVQKKGRLSEESLELINSCGISFASLRNALFASSHNFPLDVLFMRDDDIPQYVGDGVADIGIVGENEYLEKEKDVIIIKRLGFSKCRLSLALPKGHDYKGIEDFNGKSIATSYPVILQNFLDANNIQAEIHEISGSVEIAPGIGLAEGIFDIVSSGSTLLMNGLQEVHVVMKSEALLIANKHLSAEKKEILDKLVFRIDAVQRAKSNKYILLNAPNHSLDHIVSLLPGMKSPTILPLHGSGEWSSVHSVVNEDDFWGVIDKLRAAGAEGILVVPIEKMII